MELINKKNLNRIISNYSCPKCRVYMKHIVTRKGQQVCESCYRTESKNGPYVAGVYDKALSRPAQLAFELQATLRGEKPSIPRHRKGSKNNEEKNEIVEATSLLHHELLSQMKIMLEQFTIPLRNSITNEVTNNLLANGFKQLPQPNVSIQVTPKTNDSTQVDPSPNDSTQVDPSPNDSTQEAPQPLPEESTEDVKERVISWYFLTRMSAPLQGLISSLDIILVPPFALYPNRKEIKELLTIAGASVSFDITWVPPRHRMKRLVVSDPPKTHSEKKRLEGIFRKHQAPVVQVTYLTMLLEAGELFSVRPFLIFDVSNEALLNSGFPRAMVEPAPIFPEECTLD